MAFGMRGKGILGIMVALLVGLLLYAWIDGGREPLREIAMPVAVPGAVR